MKIVKRLVVWAVVILCWEALVATGIVPSIILASPLEIVQAARTDGFAFLSASVLTIGEIAASFAIAAFLGLISGCLVARSRFLAKPTAAVLSSLFAIPLVIVYPLFMAWFGIGPSSKIVFGVLSGYFPIALNTLSGVRSVEERYVMLCRAIGATRFQTYTRVLVPKALPSIITGLRVGAGLVVIGVIVAEMLASRGGIGFLISHYRSIFETGHVYLGIAIAVIFAYGANKGISAAGRKLVGQVARL